MCECGCGESPIEQAYTLPGKNVIGIKIYPGCSDCFAGPAVDISVFNNRKTEWLEHAKFQKITPDQYGGTVTKGGVIGIPIPLFEVEDLAEAARSIGGESFDEEDGYATVADWLGDNGLQMIQDAMRLFAKRMELRQSLRGSTS